MKRAAALLGLLLLAWGAGFGWFLHLATADTWVPARADGIVVLTGGAERVGTALQLLATERAPRLLVSGVARSTEMADLFRQAGLATDAVAGEVTLGRAATSTRGNAAETATWAEANGVRSLIVVTAGYHMPRALLEIGRLLPGVALYPAPVQPPAMRGHAGPHAWRLLAEEYTKWLAVRMGVVWLWRSELA